jgi:zinc protease
MNRLMLALSAAALIAAPLLAEAAQSIPSARSAQQASSARPATAAEAWGLNASDIAPDPGIRFGLLSNGMKYALMRNTTPVGHVMVRFNINVGSLAEEEDQRGLAHFLEHMAFNGSTNVPEGEMIPLLERNGLAFGADTNATTDFDDTSYRLDLPRNTPELIDTALMLMRETASELTLAPAAMDRERGVIAAERRARDGFAYRDMIDQLDFAFPGLRLTQRLPLGSEDVIRTAPAQRLRDFYERWYRPERATLVIVGDIDVAAVEASIQRRFGDWRGIGQNPPDPDVGTPQLSDQPFADIFVHPAVAEGVSVTRLQRWTPAGDTLALRRRYLIEEIGEDIVERRLSRIRLRDDAPFLGAGMSEGGQWDRLRVFSYGATTRDGQWRTGLTAVENELRRAVEHGFTDAEVAEQIAIARTAAQNAVNGTATRQSGPIADGILAMSDGDYVHMSPAAQQNLLLSMIDGPDALNGARVSAGFRAMLDGYGPPRVRLTSKTAIDGGPPALLAALDSATRLAVTPPAAAAQLQFAYTDFGPAGRVVSDDRVADLGIRRIRFANNVMLNIKRTDFQAGRVNVVVRVDGGALLAPREDPTRVSLASMLALGGLEAHSADELRTIIAGRTVGLNVGVATDFFELASLTTPADLLLQSQLYAALLRYPGYRPEAIGLIRRALPAQYAQAESTPAGVASRYVDALLTDDDPRMVHQPLERMLALDWPQQRAALTDSLTNGAIEIGIVGDISEEDAIAAIASTLGALPQRRASFEPREDQRVRRFAQDLRPRTLLHNGERDQAASLSYWSARDNGDQRESMQLYLMAGVMQLMLTEDLRERLGQSYSPNGFSNLSDDFPGFGIIGVAASVSPADLAATEAAVDAITARLISEPISDDLLTRARAPAVESMQSATRTNAFWQHSVARATSQPVWLQRRRTALGALQAVTPAQIQEVARRYLRGDRMLRIRLMSRTAAGAAADAPTVSFTQNRP